MRPFIILLFSLLPMTALAQSAQEIANRASAAFYYAGNDGRANVSMKITGKGGNRARDMVILRRTTGGVNGKQQFYVHFSRPADVNDTSFLVWKNPRASDDRWLYLPALDVVRRIASSDERTSFVGSHFFYEDVSGRSPTEDNHTLIETTGDFFVLESTPKSRSGVEFAKYRMWIHRGTYLPTKAEYYNRSGALYRTFEALKVQTIQGVPTITQARMTDKAMGGSTTISYSRVKYNVGLPGDVFSERSLRAAPERFLQ
ncbi:outer membrane lipoprotein-sorting protein [Litorisediminicola beolgyonensis]|uniref:Outer membrane lipoprotein-sorting protein n=1 Tax=Litorisediminicola beolgyonensis TaxID=1173614 RepID=A0ABW3ZKH2_9RHOB